MAGNCKVQQQSKLSLRLGFCAGKNEKLAVLILHQARILMRCLHGFTVPHGSPIWAVSCLNQIVLQSWPLLPNLESIECETLLLPNNEHLLWACC